MLTNNDILKKLRVAHKFKDEDIKSEKSSPVGTSSFSNFPIKCDLFLLAIVC